VIQNPHANPDQHQKIINSRGSPIVQAYCVWSTSVAAIVSSLAHRQKQWQNDKKTERTKT